jgi:Flp pilus assembly protein TadD
MELAKFAAVLCRIRASHFVLKPMTVRPPDNASHPGPPPVTPATRQRLQAVFEHGQASAKKGEYDYAHERYTECLIDDPVNLIYLQQLLGNLAQKYGNNKKGAKFAALRLAPSRMAIAKAAGKAQWREAFEHVCDALKTNPWNTATLLATADAYEKLGGDDCQLYVLRWALDASPKDAAVNRAAAKALGRQGQFEQSISCWKRVELAKPNDEEAAKAISQLSVERTIQKGGYQQELLHGALADPTKLEAAVRGRPAADESGKPASVEQEDSTGAVENVGRPPAGGNPAREQELLDAIQANPAELANYIELADLFTAGNRLREAEKTLSRALAASGGGDLDVQERLEETHLRRAQQQVAIAQLRAEKEKSEEAKLLAKRMTAQANQAELEVYSARAAREPGNLILQYELGLRCKRAGKFKEAIQAFQAARDDARHKALVQLHLGESFQHIRQFKLALASYVAAIEAADAMQPDTKKLALYRAGVLAAELGERERAEKYLTELAAVDFGYRDVADRLDKLAKMRDA